VGWYYRIRKRVKDPLAGTKTFVYDIVEYYDHLAAWTAQGVGPAGNTPDELYQDLHRMHASISAYPVLDEDAKLAHKAGGMCAAGDEGGQPEVIECKGALWVDRADPTTRKDA
jgi:hypothetical protein